MRCVLPKRWLPSSLETGKSEVWKPETGVVGIRYSLYSGHGSFSVMGPVAFVMRVPVMRRVPAVTRMPVLVRVGGECSERGTLRLMPVMSVRQVGG